MGPSNLYFNKPSRWLLHAEVWEHWCSGRFMCRGPYWSSKNSGWQKNIRSIQSELGRFQYTTEFPRGGMCSFSHCTGGACAAIGRGNNRTSRKGLGSIHSISECNVRALIIHRLTAAPLVGKDSPFWKERNRIRRKKNAHGDFKGVLAAPKELVLLLTRQVSASVLCQGGLALLHQYPGS